MSACAELKYELGAYALGALDDADRARVDAHLADCTDCRAEVESFAGITSRLALVSEEQVRQAAEPPPELLDRTLAQVAWRRRRGRRRVLLAAAAASVALGLGAGVGWSVLDLERRPPVAAPPTISASESSAGIAAQVNMEARGWGTALNVRMTGVPVNTSCRLVAVGRDGRRDVAASWEITYPGPARFEGATAIPRDRLQRLEIVTTDGRTLLAVPVA